MKQRKKKEINTYIFAEIHSKNQERQRQVDRKMKRKKKGKKN